MEDDDIIRTINEKSAIEGDNDIDDELIALEAEIDLCDEEDKKMPEKKNIQAKKDKEDLNNLLDLSEEKEKKDKKKNNDLTSFEEGGSKYIKKDYEESIYNKDIREAKEKLCGVDLYPEKTEKMYHKVKGMTSLGVLEKEKEICDKIIDYKKNKKEDYDKWEMKKKAIDQKISMITSTIESGKWDFEIYKKK